MFICDGLLSLSITFSRFVHVVSVLHFLFLQDNIPLCGYTTFVCWIFGLVLDLAT